MGMTLGNVVENSLAAFYEQRGLIITGFGAIRSLIH